MVEMKKAYGIVSALGTKLGERARDEPDIIPQLRAAPDLDAFRALVRQLADGRLPPAVLDAYCDEVLTPEDWLQWRARLLIQAKLIRDGGKPAPGHEAGRGVRRT